MEEDLDHIALLCEYAAKKCECYVSAEIKIATSYARKKVINKRIYSVYAGKDEVIERNTIFFKNYKELVDGLKLLIRDGYIKS